MAQIILQKWRKNNDFKITQKLHGLATQKHFLSYNLKT